MKGIVFATLEEAEPFLANYKRGRFSALAEGETLHDDNVLVTVTGVGKIKAALRTDRLLRGRSLAELLHVGTCTALVSTLKVGTLFSPSQVFEGDRIELSTPTYPRMPLTTPWEKLTSGTLVTQDHTVSGAQELTYWQRLAEASDTTGYAVAYVAGTHGVPCSILKVVSGFMGADDPDFHATLSKSYRTLGDFLVATHA